MFLEAPWVFGTAGTAGTSETGGVAAAGDKPTGKLEYGRRFPPPLGEILAGTSGSRLSLGTAGQLAYTFPNWTHGSVLAADSEAAFPGTFGSISNLFREAVL